MPTAIHPKWQAQLDRLIERGFDRSRIVEDKIFVKCSQCEALVINGTSCHESGCPNAVHYCKGCDTLIPMWRKYCHDCL